MPADPTGQGNPLMQGQPLEENPPMFNADLEIAANPVAQMLEQTRAAADQSAQPPPPPPTQFPNTIHPPVSPQQGQPQAAPPPPPPPDPFASLLPPVTSPAQVAQDRVKEIDTRLTEVQTKAESYRKLNDKDLRNLARKYVEAELVDDWMRDQTVQNEQGEMVTQRVPDNSAKGRLIEEQFARLALERNGVLEQEQTLRAQRSQMIEERQRHDVFNSPIAQLVDPQAVETERQEMIRAASRGEFNSHGYAAMAAFFRSFGPYIPQFLDQIRQTQGQQMQAQAAPWFIPTPQQTPPPPPQYGYPQQQVNPYAPPNPPPGAGFSAFTSPPSASYPPTNRPGTPPLMTYFDPNLQVNRTVATAPWKSGNNDGRKQGNSAR